MRHPKSILITGASSGIGAALARHYATPGITLQLSARDAGRLDAVAKDCRASGATVLPHVLDVIDRASMLAWIAAADAAAPLDLVIANAGVSLDEPLDDAETALRAFDAVAAINLTGVINTVYPAMILMRRRRRGQIAILGSVAAWHGFPNSPAYCASKAAVRSLAQAVRARVISDAVRIALIEPGFVATPMSDRVDAPRPFLMTAERAASLIARRLAAGARVIAFPWPMIAIVRLFLLLPNGLLDRILAHFAARADNHAAR